MPSKGIRKITMSETMLSDLREYAWERRLSVSQVIQDIMKNLRADPLYYEEFHTDLPQPTGVITVYVNDELWEPVKEKLYWERVGLSTAIRAGVTAALSTASAGRKASA